MKLKYYLVHTFFETLSTESARFPIIEKRFDHFLLIIGVCVNATVRKIKTIRAEKYNA